MLSLEGEPAAPVTLDKLRREAGVTPGFARKLAHDLVKRGWLQRVRPGVYLLNPGRFGPDALPDTDPLRVGSRLIDPYYFGFATAAELSGVFPQASRRYYIVTSSRPPQGARIAKQFQFVRVPSFRFFGIRRLLRRGERLAVSDLERTIVDCIDRPELAGGMSGVVQIFGLAKPRLDWTRLGSYLARFGSASVARRAGFLAERVRPSVRPPASWIRTLLPRASEPFVPLGHPAAFGRRGPHDARWRIVENVPRAQFFSEGEIQ